MAKQQLAFILALILIVALAAGCGTKTVEPTPTPVTSVSPEAPDDSGPADIDELDPHDLLEDVENYDTADVLGTLAFDYNVPPSKLPLTDEMVTFDFWIEAPNPAANMVNLADGEMWKELESRTNVRVAMRHPAKGSEREQFMVVVNSGDLPHMMKNPEFYPGGFEKAMDDQVFINMAEFLEWMPHYTAMLNSSESLRRDVFTDTGRIGLIHFFQYLEDGRKQKVNYGLAVRKDILEKNGWSGGYPSEGFPDTVDDLEQMLTFFKDECGFTEGPFPLSPTGVHGFSFMNGFNITSSWRLDTTNNKVEYSLIQPEFKRYLEVLNDWYNKGLIYRDFMTASGELDSQGWLFTDKVPIGLTFALFAGNQQYIIGVNPDPDYNIVGIKNVTLEPGKKPIPSQYNIENISANAYMAFAITTECPDIPLACRWWDYFFSAEGALLINYGPFEGTGPDDWGKTFYRNEDNRPILTNFIMRNPEYGSSEMLQKYVWHGCVFGMYNREVDTETPGQLETHYIWSDQDFDARYKPIPSAYTFTADESNVYTTRYNDIQTFVQEQTVKFITGDRPLSSFDEYVNEVKGMGLDEVLSALQSAIDRYFMR
jgi:putative aldouronate transport system substrate-binding protein